MGDAVNLGSRLESITKQYGVGIIVGEHTQKTVPDVVFRELDRVRVKGKDEPVAIYEPLGTAGQVDKTTLDALNSSSRCSNCTVCRIGIWQKCSCSTCRNHRPTVTCISYI